MWPRLCGSTCWPSVPTSSCAATSRLMQFSGRQSRPTWPTWPTWPRTGPASHLFGFGGAGAARSRQLRRAEPTTKRPAGYCFVAPTWPHDQDQDRDQDAPAADTVGSHDSYGSQSGARKWPASDVTDLALVCSQQATSNKRQAHESCPPETTAATIGSNNNIRSNNNIGHTNKSRHDRRPAATCCGALGVARPYANGRSRLSAICAATAAIADRQTDRQAQAAVLFHLTTTYSGPSCIITSPGRLLHVVGWRLAAVRRKARAWQDARRIMMIPADKSAMTTPPPPRQGQRRLGRKLAKQSKAKRSKALRSLRAHLLAERVHLSRSESLGAP